MGVVRDTLGNMHHGRPYRRSPMAPIIRMEKTRNSQSDAIRGRTLLLATLAVMFGINRWTGVEQRGQVPGDGQSSEIAAMPKPLSPSTPTCLALSIDAFAYRKCPHETVSGTLAVEQAARAVIIRPQPWPGPCRNRGRVATRQQ